MFTLEQGYCCQRFTVLHPINSRQVVSLDPRGSLGERLDPAYCFSTSLSALNDVHLQTRPSPHPYPHLHPPPQRWLQNQML